MVMLAALPVTAQITPVAHATNATVSDAEVTAFMQAQQKDMKAMLTVLSCSSASGNSSISKMALPARFERATCGLGNRRSIHLSYGSKSNKINVI